MNDEQVRGELAARAGEDGIVERLAKRTGASAKASAVFGKPVEREGVTVIPVARARWGFGGGSGTSQEGSGGGGGGAGIVSPLGYIEVREGGAEFKPIRDRRLIGLGVAALGVAAVAAARIAGRRS
ncbi:MAG TPA: spore germination protein GerW family protein [Solirubrobacterales bacterium]